jgi:2,4-dienoyl-CoA reductase-like NADH-dependent reductase (Old Yellow Enzyme family)
MTGNARHRLFEPLALRGVTLPNRIAISPMCQYSAVDGMANDWHVAHLGRFAMGGAGLVFVEATAVEARGRITHGDTGLWHEAQIAPMARVAAIIRRCGAVPAMQLAHAGRKASIQRPWEGGGPLGPEQAAAGETPWEVVGPSALPVDAGWLVPRALSAEDLAGLRDAWVEAARRALEAGFEVLEVHCAHGYLMHQFLSPLTNRRNDAYGGSLEGRCRFPLEVVSEVRAAWPEDRPLFVRISAVDDLEDGWTIDDSIAFARMLKAAGVDVVDCSSGGLAGSAVAPKAVRIPRVPGFQVPYAEAVRRGADLPTMAVGLITGPAEAEAVLAEGRADIVAIGRTALDDPNWPHHAYRALVDPADYARWPEQSGWWLERWAKLLAAVRSEPGGEGRRRTGDG